MMNKNLFVLSIFLAVLIIESCFSSKAVFNEPQKVEGEIMVVGNEPFTRLAVRTEGGDVFLIGCNDEIKRTLLSNQGKRAELCYDEIEKKTYNKEIHVISFKVNSK